MKSIISGHTLRTDRTSDALGFVLSCDTGQAKELSAAANSKADISFVPYGDKVAVMYNTDISDKIESARKSYRELAGKRIFLSRHRIMSLPLIWKSSMSRN